MLYTILKTIRNFFPVKGKDGEFKIENGALDLTGIEPSKGQYFLIEGSVLNDGVYQFTDDMIDLTDETFTGRVTLLAIPKELLDLAGEVESYIASGKDSTPYASESFSGYSYTKATGPSGGPVTWQSVFGSRLKAWRKL